MPWRTREPLVIDVRPNGGGDERLAQELAGCFVAERALYAKHVYRDPKVPAVSPRRANDGSSPIPIARSTPAASQC